MKVKSKFSPIGLITRFLICLGFVLIAHYVFAADAVSGNRHGPGLEASVALTLPVTRTLELTHVEPAIFAAALGKDEKRIFEFVRDQVGYEVYEGALRGPRGTLLARNGNSIDRAALLASLLKAAGQTVRFARGSLSTAEAVTLVDSMWAREQSALTRGPEPKPEIKAEVENLPKAIGGNYNLIWDTLKGAKFAAVGHDFASTHETLIAVARNHFWVQSQKEGQWIDLDPSFSDAVPGKAYASYAANLEELPESLFHHVTVRVRIEEYPVLSSGSATAVAVKRELMTFSSRSADLSGAHLVFAHQPEKWKGPVKGVARALAAGMSNTGKLKPVLITAPGKWIAGEPFRTKLPEKGGAGGLNGMLGGEGVRKPVALTMAEFVDFEFIGPDGKKDLVTRELFDLVGKASRSEGKAVTADFVRERADSPDNINLTRSIFDLFFTTGRIDPRIVDGSVAADPKKPVTVLSLLQCLNLTFAAGSDTVLSRLTWPDRSIVRFYPDSPRLQIAELTTFGNKRRLLLDLRRDHGFAAVNGAHVADAFSARIFRGVTDGMLERLLVDHLTAPGREKKLIEPTVSASAVFEEAAAKKVPSVLVSGSGPFDSSIPADVVARLKEQLSAGFVAVTPKTPVALPMGPRMAWWRINARSGETIAVTDEGLYGASTEREFVLVETSEGNVIAVEVGEETAVSVSPPRGGDPPQVFKEMEDALAWIEQEGHSVWPSSTGVVPVEPPI